MYKKQCGAILVVSLIILFSLTLFVLSSSQTAVIQEKMTAAVRDLHISLEVVESGIRDAEGVIEALTDVTGFTSSGSGGLYSETNGPADLFASATWESAKTSTATTAVSGVKANYFIEDMGITAFTDSSSSVGIETYGEINEDDDLHVFKIVSRSLGSNGHTERIVVSYYAKSF